MYAEPYVTRVWGSQGKIRCMRNAEQQHMQSKTLKDFKFGGVSNLFGRQHHAKRQVLSILRSRTIIVVNLRLIEGIVGCLGRRGGEKWRETGDRLWVATLGNNL